MKKLLLSFGDSWAYGCELSDASREQDNYTGQLGRLIGVDHTVNFSEPGSSISHLQIQLRRAIDSCFSDSSWTEVTAVFFLTGQQRFLMFDPQGEFVGLAPTGAVIRPGQRQQRVQLDSINDFYYQNIQSHRADVINLNTNLLALQSICKYYNIKDYYISGWEKLSLWPEVNRSRIYAQGQSHCAELLQLNNMRHDQNTVPNGLHPSAQGHALIAQALLNMIKNHLEGKTNNEN